MESDAAQPPAREAKPQPLAPLDIAEGLLVAVDIGLALADWLGFADLGGALLVFGPITAIVDFLRRQGPQKVMVPIGIAVITLVVGVSLVFGFLSRADITLSATSTTAGDRLTVTGSGFEAGEPISLVFGTSELPPAHAADDGTFEANVVVPEGSPDATFTARGLLSNHRASADITVEPSRSIIFWSNLDGDYDIYRIAPSGGNPEVLTHNSQDDGYPAWSPDGNRIAFARYDGSWDIWVMNAAGSDQQQLTQDSGNEMFPTWSPGGDQILYSSNRDDPEGDLYIMDAEDGTTLRHLVDQPGEDRVGSWSEGQIAFWSRRDGDGGDLFVVPERGGEPMALPVNGPTIERSPSWSPDGTELAFTSDRDRPGQLDIYVVSMASGDVRRLTSDLLEEATPAWSPNGANIAYSRGMRGSLFDIWVMSSSDGSEARELTTGESEANHLDPSWR